MNESIKLILKCYDANPIETSKIINNLKLKFEFNGNNDGVNFIKIVDLAIKNFAENKERKRIAEITAIGGSIESAKVIDLAHQMHTTGEISEDTAVKMLVNAVNIEMIKHFETPFKFDDVKLRNICEGLKIAGYITSVKSFYDGLKGIKQSRNTWIESKQMLVYFIEQIREDGKCNYAEISASLNIAIKANNKKYGYNEIDTIIKQAIMM
ncbi:MAG: hypothetical protein IPH58_03435 [Sphingobacteriales bacterium]|jgi:hypothetical protein|nr:hypothetical protein [Sphingobacteriales bacterium]